MLNSVPDPAGRARLVARFDLALTEPEWALGYSWDIVLRGRDATPFEAGGDEDGGDEEGGDEEGAP